MRWFLRLIVLAALGAGGWYGWQWYSSRGTALENAYRTSTVKRGDLLVAIGATGTVEPEEVVDVGSQVAGKVLEFGVDMNGDSIDYGSPIEFDAVLAKIDDSTYRADMSSAEAQLAQANAGVTRAEADLVQTKARLVQSEAEWHRAQELVGDSITQVEFDTARANYEVAKANVAVSEAAIIQSKSSVAQANAVIFRAERNLGFCVIKSPVKGVIIDRRVNVGQTVVSSLSAASLFLIAKDLSRMEVWVAVNEADIGQVHAGQNVTFNCDSFPGENFTGTVHKMRLNATMTQNVVTYTVEILTDNTSGRLLPYLTANVQFEVQKREDVVLVPNSALRFTPSVLPPSAEADTTGATNRSGDGSGSDATARASEASDASARLGATPNNQVASGDAPVSGDAAPTIPGAEPSDPSSAGNANPSNAGDAGEVASGGDPSARKNSSRGAEGGGEGGAGGGRGGRSGRSGRSGRWGSNGEGRPSGREGGGEGGGRSSGGDGEFGGSGGRSRSGGGSAAARGQTSGEGTVWILKDGKPLAIQVRTGLTDDTLTEILGDTLAEGTEVIVGELVTSDAPPAAAPAATTNPFAPPVMRGRGGRGRN